MGVSLWENRLGRKDLTDLPSPWIELERLWVLKRIEVIIPYIQKDLPSLWNGKIVDLQISRRLPQNSGDYRRESQGLQNNLQGPPSSNSVKNDRSVQMTNPFQWLFTARVNVIDL